MRQAHDNPAALAIRLQRRGRHWTEEEARLARHVAAAAYAKVGKERAEMGFLLVGESLMRSLSRRFLRQDKASDVLAFPPAPAPAAPAPHGSFSSSPLWLGEVFLARAPLHHEAEKRGVRFEDRLAHLALHGLLHLLGFAHDRQESAEKMEFLERAILLDLGYADPYS